MRSLIFALVIAIANHAQASCDVFKQVEDAGLYQSDAFWEDFAKISAKGQPSEAQVAQLVAKHKASGTLQPAPTASAPPTESASPRASLVGNRQIQLHRDAEKGLDKAPLQVQNRFDDLIKLVNEKGAKASVQELKTKGWDYHPIHERGMHAVKLSEGYRALLEVKDGVMYIREIGKRAYKH